MKQFQLSESNYHSTDANQRYFSASQIKQFYTCEARAMAMINGEYVPDETTSLLVGSYVDAYFSSKRTNDCTGEISGPEFEEFMMNKGRQIFNSRTGELKAEYRLADQMIRRAESDDLFMEYMSGRKQVIMTANIFGVPFKVKFDVLRDNYSAGEKRIVDLKTVRDFKPMYREGEGRLNFVEYWRYDLQLAIYQEVYRVNKGLRLPTYLACITKEQPPDIEVISVPQEQLDMCLELLSKDIERFRMVKAGILAPKRCEDCAYCRMTKRLTAPMNLSELNDYE